MLFLVSAFSLLVPYVSVHCSVFVFAFLFALAPQRASEHSNKFVAKWGARKTNIKCRRASAERRVRSSTIVVVFIDLSIIFDIGASPGALEPCGDRLGADLVATQSVYGDPWASMGQFK